MSTVDSLGAGEMSADSFRVLSPMEVNTIEWWGVYDPDVDLDDFTLQVLGDDNGVPDAALVKLEVQVGAANRSSTGVLDLFAAPIFEYRYSLPAGLSLGAGDYWLSVFNRSDTVSWYWTESSTGDGASAYRTDIQGWTLDRAAFDLAYRISGEYTSQQPVPVPAVLWLILPGIAWLLRKAS